VAQKIGSARDWWQNAPDSWRDVPDDFLLFPVLFFFSFNKLERERRRATATGAETGLMAKTVRHVANRARLMEGVFSTINDLRATHPENHHSRALPARSP
jgi:hypothetical protein